MEITSQKLRAVSEASRTALKMHDLVSSPSLRKKLNKLIRPGTIPCQVDTYKNENTIFLIQPNRGNIPPRFGHFF